MLRLRWVASMGWLWCACTTTNLVQKSVRLKPEATVAAIAVYPFSFRWSEPPYRAIELSQRLTEVALEKVGGRAMLFGPTEFRIYRPDALDWSANTLVAKLASVNVTPATTYILQPWAERRDTQMRKEMVGKGGVAGKIEARETTYLGHVEVRSPSDGQTVLEVEGQVTVDPHTPLLTADDPAPELTGLMSRLVDEAIDTLAPNMPRRTPLPPTGYAFVLQPREVLGWEKGTTEEELLDNELRLMARVRFANPGLSDGQLDQLASLPGGLWVTQAPPGGALKPGDLVLTLDGEAAVPQAFRRVMLSGFPSKAQVRRANGETVELSVP